MSKDPSISPILARTIIESDLALSVVKRSIYPLLAESEILKQFTMWTHIRYPKDNKTTLVNHQVHSSWNVEDPISMELLTRGLLYMLIPKVGIQKIQETLDLLKSGRFDDTQNHIN